jgi:hypothetical protein
MSDRLLAEVRRFSERHLPGRGWAKVLVSGSGAGAVLLAEFGYDVAVLDADESTCRGLEELGVDAAFVTLEEARGPYDAIVCAGAASPLRRKLRRGGLVITDEKVLRKRLLGWAAADR